MLEGEFFPHDFAALYRACSLFKTATLSLELSFLAMLPYYFKVVLYISEILLILNLNVFR